MKVRSLTAAAACISAFLVIFAVFAYPAGPEPESGADRGTGRAGLDSRPSPSYMYDYHGFSFQSDSILVTGPIVVGIVSLVFIVPNIVLRIKKIPTRKYTLLITTGVLIFFGYTWVSSGLQSVWVLEDLEGEDGWAVLAAGLVQIGIGLALVIIGVAALKKAYAPRYDPSL